MAVVLANSRVFEQLRRRRESRAWRTAKAGLVSHGFNYGIRFVTIPLSLSILGTEYYGLWLTVGSLIAWLSLSDFGLSRGLVNAIAEASGRDDRLDIRRLVSTGLVTFSALSIAAAVLVLLAHRWGRIGGLLGTATSPELTRNAGTLLLICGLFFAASIPLRAVDSVCQGLQEGYLGAYAGMVSALLGLMALAILRFRGATVVEFALVSAAPPLFTDFTLGAYVFLVRHPDLFPVFRLTNTSSLRKLMAFGGPLLLVQLANLAFMYSMNILIANRLGPAQVPKFAVPYALFMVVAGLCNLIAQPLVPAIAEAFRHGDWAWVEKVSIRLLSLLLGVMGAADIAFLLVGRPLIRFWAGPEVTPGWTLLLALCCFSLVQVFATGAGVLLVGLGLLLPRAGIHLFAALFFVVTAWALLPKFGIISIPLVGSVAFALPAGVWTIIAFRHIDSHCKTGTSESGEKT